MKGGDLNLLVMQLHLGAVDGRSELLDSLVPQLLVDLLGGCAGCGVAGLLVLLRDGGELERERELVVGLGDVLVVFRLEFLLVLEGFSGVGDRVRISAVGFISKSSLGRNPTEE